MIETFVKSKELKKIVPNVNFVKIKQIFYFKISFIKYFTTIKLISSK